MRGTQVPKYGTQVPKYTGTQGNRGDISRWIPVYLYPCVPSSRKQRRQHHRQNVVRRVNQNGHRRVGAITDDAEDQAHDEDFQ